MSKYILYFETLEDSEGFTIEIPFSGYVNNLNVGIFSLKNGIISNGRVCDPRIYYTSSDNNVITPYTTDVFGASIISNTYDNVGILDFDGLVTSIGRKAFCNCSSLTSITIPEIVTSIGSDAFYNCSSLTSITIPSSVTSIGEQAFRGCSTLTSITIPNSVTSIGKSAFLGCNSLNSIVVENGNTTYDSRENCNAIIKTATNTLISGCRSTIIPNSVTSIGERAFSYCSSLTSIVIPNSVTSIGKSAFSSCSSLTSVTIGNSVTSIGDMAFMACYKLLSVTIPNSVTIIKLLAFCDCSTLASITIPNSVTEIEYNVLSMCYALTTITCEATTPPTLGSKNNLANVTAVYVPAESVDLYKNATNWSYYSGVIKPIE